MTIPHGLPAKDFIDWVNKFGSQDEARRCRILLAEVLLRMEKDEQHNRQQLVKEIREAVERVKDNHEYEDQHGLGYTDALDDILSLEILNTK